jgi:hypothetical protein
MNPFLLSSSMAQHRSFHELRESVGALPASLRWHCGAWLLKTDAVLPSVDLRAIKFVNTRITLLHANIHRGISRDVVGSMHRWSNVRLGVGRCVGCLLLSRFKEFCF